MDLDDEAEYLVLEQHPLHSKFLMNIGFRRAQTFTSEAVNCQRQYFSSFVEPYNANASEIRMDLLNESMYQSLVSGDSKGYYNELDNVVSMDSDHLNGLCYYIEEEMEGRSYSVSTMVSECANTEWLRNDHGFVHPKDSLEDRLTTYMTPN